MHPQPTQETLPVRNLSGWFSLAVIFLLLVPAVIIQSYKGSDLNSKKPSVQASNLEATVTEKTGKGGQQADLQKIVNAMAPAHTTDEEASAVFAVASAELKKPLTAADLKPLQDSKLPRNRTLAALYLDKPSPEYRSLANSLPTETFLYKLAKAQALEKLGDRSLRNEISPELSQRAISPITVVLGGLVLLGLLIGFVLLFAYAVMLADKRLIWRGHPLEPATMVDADRLAIRAAQIMGVFLAASIIVEYVAQAFPGPKSDGRSLTEGVAASALMLAGTLLLFRVPVMGKSFGPEAFGITRRSLGQSFAWGVAGVFAVVPVILFGSLIGSLFKGVSPRPDHPLTHLLSGPNVFFVMVAALFMASVQAPILEELLFRGTLLPALSGLFRNNRFHVPMAIAVSSLVFASIHPQGFVLWLPIAGIGVVNSILCYQTRSVLPGMFMHGIYNGALLMLGIFYK